jgi:hypothetical protein
MAAEEPQLILCDPCKRQNESQWSQFVNKTTGKISARFEVCVAVKCIAPQVRRHFCRDHVLEYELYQLKSLKIRTCHHCGKNLLKFYEENQQVWFFVHPEGFQPPIQAQKQQQKQGENQAHESLDFIPLPVISSSIKLDSGKRLIYIEQQCALNHPRHVNAPIEINDEDNCVCLQTFDELFREKCLGCHPPKCSFDQCNRLAKEDSYCLFHAKLPSSIYYSHEKNVY